ncbi:MAG: GNAT family N-acetyltransferase [Boseongicola sp. SB0662_bin_57]|nr:GNAT family N-acetyltransferase [Boseongicola sp. SB0662_bin_57]
MTRNESGRAKDPVGVEIRAVLEQDRPGWCKLFAGYGRFYDQQVSEEVLDRVWGWLMDGDHPTSGLVAVRDGQIVGIAHFRPYCRTLTGGSACFLDDLFVAPAERGRGVGRQLIEATSMLAEKAGWDFVRWMTAQDNRQAQQLYDSVAERTEWLTYQLSPQPGRKA